jgi:ABC-type Fe3+/spermidine/putrescine transport system ATPase subunit
VTHDLEEAGLLGHRVGIVMEGGLAQLAPPEEIFRAPATLEVARFLGYRNELPCAPGSGVEARLFGGVAKKDPGEAEARNVARDVGRDFRAGNTAAGSRSVVVLPPGSVRGVPASRSSTLSEGEAGEGRGRWVPLPGRLRHLAHPGPRPLARVEVDLPNARPVLLEAEVEDAALADARADASGSFEPGSPVVLLVDVSRALRF